MNEKNKKYRKAKLLADRITSVDSSKMKFYVGRWLGNKMRHAEVPFDSIENINEADRFDMAKMYWEEEGNKKWQYLKKLDGKPIATEELLPFIARDIDYRIIKATAKYIFKITDKNAGVVVIDPDTYPYSQIKVQYRETYSILKDEVKSYIFQVDQKREYLRQRVSHSEFTLVICIIPNTFLVFHPSFYSDKMGTEIVLLFYCNKRG